MLVMKFGGTSVGSADRMTQVLQIVRDKSAGKPAVVVLSAMSGVTNALIDGANCALSHKLDEALAKVEWLRAKHVETIAELFKDMQQIKELEAELDERLEELRVLYKGVAYLGELSRRSLDAVSGVGELLSSAILARYAQTCGVKAVWLDARSFVKTTDDFGRAQPLSDEIMPAARQHVLPHLEAGALVITQGFIGSTTTGASTTLGRGGSDYSASIIGVAVGAREIQIWTDVDGMLSADPRVVPNAHLLAEVSFQEASELAYFGAKVLHPLTIKPAVEKDIPVKILNTFAPANQGTTITSRATSSDTIRAVAAKKHITAVFLSSPHMLMTHGFLAQVFAVFDRLKIPIDLISTSEVSVALTIDSRDHLNDLVLELKNYGDIQIMDDVAIVSVVGRQFREQSGIAGRVFNALHDVNIIVISGGASDINLNFVVSSSDADKAVRQLHSEFFG